MKKAGLETYLQVNEAPSGLYAAILLRIKAAQLRAARVRTGLFGALALLSLVALVPALQYTAEQFYASGFYDYLLLIVSDHSLVLTYWQQFALTLIESLPSLALLLLVPVVVVLLYSLRKVIQTGRVAFGGRPALS